MGRKPNIRTEQEVIDSALRENRHRDTICWVLACLFAVSSVAVVFVGVIAGSPWVGATGAALGVPFAVALNAGLRIRRENIALRLLEIALRAERTEEGAMKAIGQAFQFHFASSQEKPHVVAQPKTDGAGRGPGNS